MGKTLVAGIGSPYGADRLGWAVIDALGECGLAEAVTLRACRTPSELTPLLLTCSRAVVVDALLGDGPAGAIHWLTMADLPGAALRLSSHGAGLVEAVQLASALGMPEDRLQLLVLEVGHAQADLQPAWIDALVAQVRAALPSTA